MPDANLEYLHAIWVAALRHGGPHDPRVTDDTWQRLIVWASPRGLLGRSLDMRGVGLLWDDPRAHDPRDRRYDVGVPIDPQDAAEVDHPAFVAVTAPGRYLKVVHEGPYDRILETYDRAISEHLRYGDWTLLAQPIVEVYRNSPAEVAIEELRTDLYFPVARL